MFGMLSAAFGVGQALGGVFGAKSARKVAGVKSAFDSRVAGINAVRVGRENRYGLGLQRTQFAATGNAQRGSSLFVAADDARKARERVSQVHIDAASRAASNAAGTPSQGAAATSFLSKAARFGFNYGKIF